MFERVYTIIKELFQCSKAEAESSTSIFLRIQLNLEEKRTIIYKKRDIVIEKMAP